MTHESWLTKALGGEEDEALREHLALCASCRQELEALRGLEREIRALAPPAVPDDLWSARTFQAVRGSLRPRWGEGARTPWGTIAALLLAGLSLVAGLLFLPHSSPGGSSGASETALLWDVTRDNGTLALLESAESLVAETEEEQERQEALEAPQASEGGGSHG